MARALGRRLAVAVICGSLIMTSGTTGAASRPVAPGSAPAASVSDDGQRPVDGGYRWPLDGRVVVSRQFDPPLRRWLPGHRGVDLPARPEAVVRAAGDGTVWFTGPVGGRGVVSLAHPDGLRTTYQPVVPLVATGERVRAGDPIARLESGHAGCGRPACLHWGLRQGELYLDPLTLLSLGRARLLPG